jgi:ankyrin repeat protein
MRCAWRPLERASENGHVEVVQVLLEHDVDVNTPDIYGVTALHVASDRGQLIVARMLLGHGADASAKLENGATPLHWAKNEGVSRVLLEYGADPNALDSKNWTPLHCAMLSSRIEVARVLLENGEDTNAQYLENGPRYMRRPEKDSLTVCGYCSSMALMSTHGMRGVGRLSGYCSIGK